MFPGIKCPYCNSENIRQRNIKRSDELRDDDYFDIDVHMLCCDCGKVWDDFYEIHLYGRSFDDQKII